MQTLAELEAEIEQALGADRFGLRRRLRQIRRAQRENKPFEKNLARFERELAASRELRQKKLDARPPLNFDPDLPITAKRDEIGAAIREHPVVIVCGETGSGKSTQLPKICLDIGRGVDGIIGHTQPRRLAARSVASRLAQELSRPLGDAVGFKIRFADQTKPETYVKLMTDGILLAETQHDRFLNQYDTIIVDEAHERSLNIDFLIGYLCGLIPKRPDLRVIITSATIDTARFADHFTFDGRPAPVVEVSGRTYPVEVRYRPPLADAEDAVDADDPDLSRLVADAVDEALEAGDGDLLVFLPTERDIREAAKVLRGRIGNSRSVELLPLYARLASGDQDRIYQPHKGRRIVLATNVAESSITVPGIRYVVDTGLVRMSRFSTRSQVQRLPIEAISRASADQRKGRCGRVGPGVCIRLYSEEDYETRDAYTTPEIRRTNLASVILQTLALNLGSIEEYPFLDPPRADTVRDGYKSLFELGAINEQRELTETGRRLARLPVDPRIGRMLLAAADERCLHEMLIVAAALEVQDPRDRPAEKQQQADAAHAEFADERSDFLSYLRLWDFYQNLREKASRSGLRKACHQHFLSYNRLREWADVVRQLREQVEREGFRVERRRDDPDALHRALIPGLLSQVAMLSEKGHYVGAGGGQFFLWPGSALAKKKPRWVLAGELVETSRRFLRTVGPVNPSWIEPAAEHLVKRSVSDFHWSRKQGAAMGQERVTLFGLPIVPRRRIPLGPIDSAQARELFIQHGLIEGELPQSLDFLEHNRETLAEVEQMGAKTRSREFLVDEYAQYRFYDSRLPASVYDLHRLRRWRKKSPDEAEKLKMTTADLLGEKSADKEQAAFPDALETDRNRLPLEYLFDPGSGADGVTVTVPAPAVGQLSPARLEWLVPGLVEEKIVALIRTLPKATRRNLIPAPDVARQAASRLTFGQGDFLQAVSRALREVTGEVVPPQEFEVAKLPEHLRMRVRVVDDAGEEVAASRDLETLQRELEIAPEAPTAAVADPQWSRDGLTEWDFGDLPKSLEIKRQAAVLTAYPAVVDQEDAVGLRLFDTPERRKREHRAGLRRLFIHQNRRALRTQVSWLPALKQLRLVATTLMPTDQLEGQLLELLADRALFPDNKLILEQAAFEQRLAEAGQRIAVATQDVAKLIGPLIELHHEALVAAEGAKLKFPQAGADMERQLAALTEPGFLVETPFLWLEHYPRYFEAILYRAEKLPSNLARDRDAQAEIEHWWAQYLERRIDHQRRGLFDPEIVHFRWMLEEYRVSCFAQPLGTSLTVSAKRLEKQWAKVG